MGECGECTLCCKLLQLNTVPSAIGEVCRHCTMGAGCNIYETRPNECREFRCMWLQMENAGIEMRPDKCGILFDKMSDDVICARLEEGKKLKPLVMGQINAFIDEGYSVLIFRGMESKCFLTADHTENYVRDTVHGRSNIH